MNDAICNLLRDVAATRPQIGMLARVVEGKHAGTLGRITWHGPDRFASVRYLDDTQRQLRECRGINGFRVRIQPDNAEPVFVPVEKVVYCVTAAGVTP